MPRYIDADKIPYFHYSGDDTAAEGVDYTLLVSTKSYWGAIVVTIISVYLVLRNIPTSQRLNLGIWYTTLRSKGASCFNKGENNMAKIGLWSDCHNFPSLPLMKLSAYHKSIGDTTEHYLPLNHYDLVYASKVFSFTPDIDDTCIVQADEVRRGGTGYCISVWDGKEVFDSSKDTPLPKEIEHIYPDYDLYPDYKYAVGFLTRGCPRGCGFCIVGSKEGRCSHQVADLSEFWRGQREIKLAFFLRDYGGEKPCVVAKNGFMAIAVFMPFTFSKDGRDSDKALADNALTAYKIISQEGK